MAKRTPIYDYYVLEQGDVVYPGFDKKNMQTIENQMSGLLRFVGPGVISGWQVTSMAKPDTNSPKYNTVIEQRREVSNSNLDPTDDLRVQYSLLGEPVVNEDGLDSRAEESEAIWSRTIRVSSGVGVVGLYRAATNDNAYILLPKKAGIYDVWAEPGPSLISDGLVVITITNAGDDITDSTRVATYLATVHVNTSLVINKIEETSDRKDLNHLLSPLKESLKKYYYRHVHSGAPQQPAKIYLTTVKRLIAKPSDNASATSFLVYDPDYPLDKNPVFSADSAGHVTWNKNNVGVPTVYLDEELLKFSDYNIDSGQGIIYLQNSIPPTSLLQIILPRVKSIKLIAKNITAIVNGEISLKYDTSSLPVSWEATEFESPKLYFKDDMIPQYKTVQGSGGNPEQVQIWRLDNHTGVLTFLHPEDDLPNITNNTDLFVVLSPIANEVEGVLSGGSLQNVDASSFTKGILPRSRIGGLDHVGQLRFREQASLKPHLRLLDQGDHRTYYPEIIDAEIQYNTIIECIYYSSYCNTNFIGTRNGLLQTSDFQVIRSVNSWSHDMGTPIHILDQSGGYFKTTFILTAEGQVYFTEDAAITWKKLKLPQIEYAANIIITPKITSMIASTTKYPDESSGFIAYKYAKVYYIGTESNGLFTATVQEGQTDNEWTWSRVVFPSSTINNTIYTLAEVCTINYNIQVFSTLENTDRSIYIGADDGFYAAFKGGSPKKIEFDGWIYNDLNGTAIKEIHTIASGDGLNNIVWRTDSQMFHTHTAQEHIVTSGRNTRIWWQHPFEDQYKSAGTLVDIPQVTVATTSDSDIEFYSYDEDNDGALLTSEVTAINGVNLELDMPVLITHFSSISAPYNGLYKFTETLPGLGSVFVRIMPMISSADLVNPLFIKEENNLVKNLWYFAGINTPTIDVSDITFSQIWFNSVNVENDTFTAICEIPDLYEYWVLGHDNIFAVKDYKVESKWQLPVVSAKTYSGSSQGISKSALSTSVSGIVIGTSRGLWISATSGKSWVRKHNELDPSPNSPIITVYNGVSGEKILPSAYTVDNISQSIVFDVAQSIDASFIYEKDYTDYYIAPWHPLADIIIYKSNVPVSVPFSTTPAQGKIVFSVPMAIDSEIAVTISHQGAFIKNIGVTPHEELDNLLLVQEPNVTTLKNQLLPNDSELVVTDRAAIPVNTHYLELRWADSQNRLIRERLAVSVNAAGQIAILNVRNATEIVPADSTKVYLVETGSTLGIEDVLSIAESNQTYHFNSLNNANIVQRGVNAKSEMPELFNRFFIDDFEDEPNALHSLGPKNAVFASLATMDTTSSSDKPYIGSPSTITVDVSKPDIIYAVQHPVDPVSGVGMRVFTNKGVWLFSDNMWTQESTLNNATNVYLVSHRNGVTIIGTDTGLWYLSDQWYQDALYSNFVYDYLECPWFGGTGKIYAKNNGIAFVWKRADNTFISDSFSAVDGRNVYGLYKSYYQNIDDIGEGGSVSDLPKYDVLYLCTEIGLFIVTVPISTSKGFLVGKEAFGAEKLKAQVLALDGSEQTVPVKVYKIFQAFADATNHINTERKKPIIILTSNGVYLVRNWAWCAPSLVSNNFVVEAHHLDGRDCKCYAVIDSVEDISNPNPPPATVPSTITKIFIGTDKGLWRSYDEGYQWENCERFNGDDLAVYSISHYDDGDNTILVVGTERGLYTSSDDGDTWQRPGSENMSALYPYIISSGIPLKGRSADEEGSLAVSFATTANSTEVSKISVYLDLNI